MAKVNSKEYWNDRYLSRDWDKKDGEGQSAFFSEVMIKSVPDDLKEEIKTNNWTAADYGCAEGAGTDCLARFFTSCHFTGLDFSEAAIKIASSKYYNCDFKVFDLTEEKRFPTFDLTFSSNVLEHLSNPFSALEKIVHSARYYSFILIPFEDHSKIEEHINFFDSRIFDYQIPDYSLCNAIISDWRGNESPFWKEKQVLLIYYNNKHCNHPNNSLIRNFYFDNLQPLQDSLLEKEKCIQTICRQNSEYVSENNNLKKKLAEYGLVLESHSRECNRLIQETNTLKLIEQKNQEEIQKLKDEVDRERSQKNDLLSEIENVRRRAENSRTHAINELSNIINTGNDLSSIKSFQLVHFISRFKYQLMKGTSDEKREFFRWLFHRGKRNPNREHSYNPLFQMIIPLGALKESLEASAFSEDIDNSSVIQYSSCNKSQFSFLLDDYSKYDVIILGVIDYDFRFQRPQQIADYYCKNGHRVLYINANFSVEKIRESNRGNLSVITIPSRLNAIYSLNDADDNKLIANSLESVLYSHGVRDGIIIVDYPKWVKVAESISNKYGFRLITDYMDDYTGFVTTADSTLKEDCINLLKASDCVFASSTFLSKIAAEYNQKVKIVRNGTDFEHFFPAFSNGKKSGNGKKIVGYYGAIAEWFDFEKVKYLAEVVPDIDIVLVGNITNDEVKKCKIPNIKKVGEVSYADLPKYLETFDVCLIPFKTDTDLIKATNPVKFYEYLSAGKKIVATKIPELEEFENRFAYLSNDNKVFADDVKKCLAGDDDLADASECIAFAKLNTWENRIKEFDNFAVNTFPKISIIILCYNQLEYTKKCVNSILKVTAYPNFEVILIDNCSTDGTAEFLEKLKLENTNIKIKINDLNRGFAGGNNDGIIMADGEYIVLLNNDTIVTRGWLSGMLKQFLNKDAVGIVGPVTNSIGNEAEINVDYHDVENMPYFAYQYTASHMGMTYPGINVLAMYCVMFPKALVNKIGLLDENYGKGMFEDDDYSMAARKSGYSLILSEDVFIHHFGSASFKKLKDSEYRKIFEQNKEYFEKKWNVKWHAHHYRMERTR